MNHNRDNHLKATNNFNKNNQMMIIEIIKKIKATIMIKATINREILNSLVQIKINIGMGTTKNLNGNNIR
jgi:hypothetical protein